MQRWKARARDLLASAYFPFFQTRTRSAQSDWAERLHIVTFHRVLPAKQLREYPLPGLAVTPDELRKFLEFFTDFFDCGTLFDVATRFERGLRTARPLLAISFDDGTIDNFLHARPLLNELGIRASFFVPTSHIETQTPLWHDALGFAAYRALQENTEHTRKTFCDWGVEACADPVPQTRAVVRSAKAKPLATRSAWIRELRALARGETIPAWDGMMSIEQLATLIREGHEIGSHSSTHPLLPECDDAKLATEISGSKAWLETRLGVAVSSFCYPNGDFDSRAVAEVAKAGYRFAVTTRWGGNAPPLNAYALDRFDMHAEHTRDHGGNFSKARLAWRMSGFSRASNPHQSATRDTMCPPETR